MISPTFEALVAQVEADDLISAGSSRFLARPRLHKALVDGGAPEALTTAAQLECMLFAPFFGRALPALDGFADDFRSEVGLLFAAIRFSESRSPIVRAHAGWFLWISKDPRFRSGARHIALAFIEWLEHQVSAALTTPESVNGHAVVELLRRADEVVRTTGQTPLRPRLIDAALRFTGQAEAPPLLHGAIGVARFIGSVPKELLNERRQEVEVLSQRLRVGANWARDLGDRHPVHVGFMRADVALRRWIGLPDLESHGPLAIARAIEADALQGSAIRRSQMLALAIREYRGLRGHADDARRLESLREAALRKANSELKLISCPIRLSHSEVAQVIAPYSSVMMAGALRELGFDPNLRVDVDDLKRSAAEHDETFVSRRLFPALLFGGDATTVRPESEEAQAALRERQDAVSQMGFYANAYLSLIFSELRTRGLMGSDVMRQLYSGSVFDEVDRPFLERGVQHWIEKDHISAMSVLVPRVERVLRRMLDDLGSSTLVMREDADERLQLSTVLKRLLERADDELTRSLFYELSVFLDGGGGLAVRHSIAHGLADEEFFSAEKTDLLIGLLLRLSHLSQVRTRQLNDPPRHDGDSPREAGENQEASAAAGPLPDASDRSLL